MSTKFYLKIVLALVPLIFFTAGFVRANPRQYPEYHDNIRYYCENGSIILNCRVIAGPMRGRKVSCGWPVPDDGLTSGAVSFNIGGRGWDRFMVCWKH